jgi:hypothetical protein
VVGGGVTGGGWRVNLQFKIGNWQLAIENQKFLVRLLHTTLGDAED